MANVIVVTYRDGLDTVAVVTLEGPVLNGTVLSAEQESVIKKLANAVLAGDWNQQARDVGEPEAAVFVPETCAKGLTVDVYVTALHRIVTAAEVDQRCDFCREHDVFRTHPDGTPDRTTCRHTGM